MARPRSFDGGFDDLPKAVQVALSVDRSYAKDAYCRNPRNGEPGLAWTIDPKDSVKIGESRYSGRKLQAAALLGCSGCDVQWECAAVALEAGETACVWGDTIENLRFLHQRRPNDFREFLMLAKSTGTPVQRAIAHLRAV